MDTFKGLTQITGKVTVKPQFAPALISFPYSDFLMQKMELSIGDLVKVYGLTVLKNGYQLHTSKTFNEDYTWDLGISERDFVSFDLFVSSKFRSVAELIEHHFNLSAIYRKIKTDKPQAILLTVPNCFCQLTAIDPYINFDFFMTADMRPATWLLERQEKGLALADFLYLANEVDYQEIGTPDKYGYQEVEVKSLSGIDLY